MLSLRIFLSSPGDVAEEREITHKVVSELAGSHLLRERVTLDLVTWDDPRAATPMEVGVTPQESVNRFAGKPSDCDLTVVVLWSRIGSVPEGLTRADGSAFASGTVWELENARAASKPVWFYRRTSKPQIDIDDDDLDAKRAQYAAVNRLFEGFKGDSGGLKSGINSYAAPADFARLLRQHLEAFVNERLPIASTAQSDEVERLLGKLTLENQLLRSENEQLQAQLRAAVARTLMAAAEPCASPQAIDAAAALQRGDTRPAEAALRQEERSAAAEAAMPSVMGEAERAANRQAAELAREQGALAFGRDAQAALAAYQRAAAHDPDDTWTQFLIGDLYVALGDLTAARAHYDAGHSSALHRLENDPDDADAERDLAVSHDRIGNALVAQGDGPGALTAYRTSLAIAARLAAYDSDHTQPQRDLSVSHNKIGDVLVAQGDGTAALTAYRAGLAIRERLAAHDPNNTEWQRDLSVSHERIGDVLVAQGEGPGALTAYRAGRAIRERLAAHDPNNALWQTDLAISCGKLGAFEQLGSAERCALLQRGRDILQCLHADNRLAPSQTGWVALFDDMLRKLDGPRP
ncbi:MAG: tetratricopeptide repeat protein [Burkholderiaceae bacterium]